MGDAAAGRVLPLRALALALTLGLLLLGGRAAAGELIGDLRGDLGLGITDNARSAPSVVTQTGMTYNPPGDGLATAGAGARLRYNGARVNHSLGYQVAGRWYLQGNGSSGFDHSVAWQTTAILSQTLTLDLGASAGYARAAVFDSVDPRYYVPVLRPLGDNVIFSLSANEGLAYQPNPRRLFSQSFAASRVYVIESAPGNELPETTMLASSLRGEQALAINQINADVTTTYMKSDYARPGRADREWLLVQLLAGVRRDLNPRWSAEARAGAVGVFLLDGLRGIIAPAVQLTASYQSTPWFFNAMFTQTATPNPYYATTTIADAVLLRAALPLTRSERYFFMGYGSYVYGRTARGIGELNHVFDAFTVGATLTARSEKYPVFAALDYVFVDQEFVGGFGPAGGHLRRQQLMLNVGALLSFGKGQPSPFRGLL